jgi:hypothetical protein
MELIDRHGREHRLLLIRSRRSRNGEHARCRRQSREL